MRIKNFQMYMSCACDSKFAKKMQIRIQLFHEKKTKKTWSAIFVRGHSITTWTRWGGGGQKLSVFVHAFISLFYLDFSFPFLIELLYPISF